MLKTKRVEGRRAWAAANGWAFAEKAIVPVDAMTGRVPRRPTVEVTDEIRGRYGRREAFVHDRAPLVGGTEPSQFMRSVSGVSVAVSLPMAFVLFPSDARGFRAVTLNHAKLRAYLMPHVGDFEHYRDAFGSRSLIWCQPGAGQYFLHLVQPLLEAPLSPPGGPEINRRGLMLATGGSSILMCDPLAYTFEDDLQRLGIAARVAERAEQLAQRTADA
ncbi:hypothetical protein EHW97_11215 [Aeromicrobium camelliae]|uniref:Uncharacterized protein n=1 Tax=Aeromicrobium camelliae TaxID=1538144 RepID=A0A3N6Z7S0_9ACTN|nr:hypothetical protein [Aeromicrobium camelliae]RQN02997.1 hypothetical protein EHW97_11215 [Aeromicrobium camelliae]